MKRQTESVWDYPRPPRLEPSPRRIRVLHAGLTLADTTHALRLLETSHPPVYYIPPQDIGMSYLQRAARGSSFCEFKGSATYWSFRNGSVSTPDIAWSYAQPTPAYAALRDHLAFYASRVDACFVDDEQVQPQAGDFYGGWITSHVTGPFKGAPGTMGW